MSNMIVYTPECIDGVKIMASNLVPKGLGYSKKLNEVFISNEDYAEFKKAKTSKELEALVSKIKVYKVPEYKAPESLPFVWEDTEEEQLNWTMKFWYGVGHKGVL